MNIIRPKDTQDVIVTQLLAGNGGYNLHLSHILTAERYYADKVGLTSRVNEIDLMLSAIADEEKEAEKEEEKKQKKREKENKKKDKQRAYRVSLAQKITFSLTNVEEALATGKSKVKTVEESEGDAFDFLKILIVSRTRGDDIDSFVDLRHTDYVREMHTEQQFRVFVDVCLNQKDYFKMARDPKKLVDFVKQSTDKVSFYN